MLLIPLKWRHSILNGGLLITSSFKCGMKLLIRFRTSTVASLKFRNSAMVQLFKYWNGYVISSHASLNVWLLIHAGMAKTDTAELKVRPKTDRAEMTLQWRHNGQDSVSNHQPHDCLPNRLFRRRSKKASKLRVTGLWAGNSPGTGEFSAQRASNAEYVSIRWRHHGKVHPPVIHVF